MGTKSFAAILSLTLLACVGIYLIVVPRTPFNPAEVALFDALDALAARDRLAPADFVAAFGLPDSCQSGDCTNTILSNSALRGVTAELRRGNDGYIFTLDGLDRVCVRKDRVRLRYRGGTIEDHCLDSNCPHYGTTHRWGLLGFDWPPRQNSCVGDVVINTEHWFRQGG